MPQQIFLMKNVVISTPDEGMDPKVVVFMEDAWRKAGARVQTMSPHQHDLTFASVSHLPHVLAYCLVDMDCERRERSGKTQDGRCRFP